MKKHILYFMVYVFASQAFAQDYRYQFGIDGGYTKPLFYSTHPWEISTPDFNFNFGIQFQDHLNDRWQLDYGIFYKSIAYTRTNTFDENDTIVVNPDDKIENIAYHFIELPITFRYNVLKDSKFKFLPGFGIRPALSIQEQTIGNFGFGLSLSMAMEYQLNEKWKLRVDPVYTYRLPFWGDFSVNFGIYRSITNITNTANNETKDNDLLKRNAVAITAGYGVIVASFQIGYERLFWEKKKNLHQAAYGNVNFGGFSSFDESIFGSILGGYLIGNKNKFLDISLGVLATDGKTILPSGAFGYRYQNNNVQFRTGIGFIEGVYVGFARTF